MKTTLQQIEEAKSELRNARAVLARAEDDSTEYLHAVRAVSRWMIELAKLGACSCAVCAYEVGTPPCPLEKREPEEWTYSVEFDLPGAYVVAETYKNGRVDLCGTSRYFSRLLDFEGVYSNEVILALCQEAQADAILEAHMVL